MPADRPGCGYRGAEFVGAEGGSICAGGSLWDACSVTEVGSADFYTIGGVPCPSCNRQLFIKAMAQEWFQLGIKEFSQPLSVKALKNTGIHHNWVRLGLSRPFRRHYFKGRRFASSEEKKVG